MEPQELTLTPMPAQRSPTTGPLDTHPHSAPRPPTRPPGVQHAASPAAAAKAGSGSDRAAAASRRSPPSTLDLSIRRRGAVIELGLSGDLDMATAPRVREAMAWLRFSRGARPTVVIDTTDLAFISTGGYRALQAAQVGANGLWDPRVALIVGPAVARLEAAISAGSTPSPSTARPPGDARHPSWRRPSSDRGPPTLPPSSISPAGASPPPPG